MGYTYVYSAALVDTCGFEETALTVGERRGMEGKREFGVNAVVSHLAACQKSSREYVRDIYCLGRLSALSTDSFFLVQSLFTSIVRSPEEIRTQEAFAALQRRLFLFEEKGLYLLLRQLVQQCPYPNVSGLLIDVIKVCSQAASRRLRWQIPTLLGRAFCESSWARMAFLTRLSCKRKGCKYESAQFFLIKIKVRRETIRPRNSNQTRLNAIAEEVLVLSWRAASPFWSPLGF